MPLPREPRKIVSESRKELYDRISDRLGSDRLGYDRLRNNRESRLKEIFEKSKKNFLGNAFLSGEEWLNELKTRLQNPRERGIFRFLLYRDEEFRNEFLEKLNRFIKTSANTSFYFKIQGEVKIDDLVFSQEELLEKTNSSNSRSFVALCDLNLEEMPKGLRFVLGSLRVKKLPYEPEVYMPYVYGNMKLDLEGGGYTGSSFAQLHREVHFSEVKGNLEILAPKGSVIGGNLAFDRPIGGRLSISGAKKVFRIELKANEVVIRGAKTLGPGIRVINAESFYSPETSSIEGLSFRRDDRQYGRMEHIDLRNVTKIDGNLSFPQNFVSEILLNSVEEFNEKHEIKFPDIVGSLNLKNLRVLDFNIFKRSFYDRSSSRKYFFPTTVRGVLNMPNLKEIRNVPKEEDGFWISCRSLNVSQEMRDTINREYPYLFEPLKK